MKHSFAAARAERGIGCGEGVAAIIFIVATIAGRRSFRLNVSVEFLERSR